MNKVFYELIYYDDIHGAPVSYGFFRSEENAGTRLDDLSARPSSLKFVKFDIIEHKFED